MSVEEEIRGFAHALAEDLDRLFDDLEGAAALVRRRLGSENANSRRWGPFQPDQLRMMEAEADSLLERHPLVYGAGIIFDPDRIVSPEQLIPWRVRGESGAPEAYGFDFDEHSRDYYDFLQLPWFAEPKATGEPKFTTPYVDFLGVDEYILTAAVPFADDYGFVGVAGSDIEVSTLERVMMRAAKNVSGRFVLLGAEGRIVCSTTARFLPGELLEQDTVSGHQLMLPTRVPTLSLYWE
ncbi:PDC sensor domain-containing protein [Nesterenkonia natronophila]|nr:cache domain-containing protein [Nesterenkonia natronophila]